MLALNCRNDLVMNLRSFFNASNFLKKHISDKYVALVVVVRPFRESYNWIIASPFNDPADKAEFRTLQYTISLHNSAYRMIDRTEKN